MNNPFISPTYDYFSKRRIFIWFHIYKLSRLVFPLGKLISLIFPFFIVKKIIFFSLLVSIRNHRNTQLNKFSNYKGKMETKLLNLFILTWIFSFEKTIFFCIKRKKKFTWNQKRNLILFIWSTVTKFTVSTFMER